MSDKRRESDEEIEEDFEKALASIHISKTEAEKRAVETKDMIDKIIDGLYISDAASVISSRGKEKIKELDITNILTTSGMPIPDEQKIPNIQYKFVFMMDLYSQDILGNDTLDSSVNYIDTIIKSGGKILVHCEVGISRSVTIVAGYLMKKFEWTPSKAIICIQKSRPIACPNSSFIRQLAIYKHLDYKADSYTLADSQHYRHFCADTGNVPHIQLPQKSEHHIAIGPSTKAALLADSKHRRYKCRKCRTDLFYDTNILRHTLGGRPGVDDDYSEGLHNVPLCMFDYLITPMKWMSCEEYQGKINCPKCHEKLGQFIWGGRECQGDSDVKCGRHVTPWFHIQKIKVDEAPMSQLAAKLAHLPTIVRPPQDSNNPVNNERVEV